MGLSGKDGLGGLWGPVRDPLDHLSLRVRWMSLQGGIEAVENVYYRQAAHAVCWRWCEAWLKG